MGERNEFWQLSQLADADLLAGLSALLCNQRRSLAEVVAHLGEVEERRLHLRAAHASMFDYCVRRLGMSEDEACRRIELARLARKYPALFEELASGALSLSVVLILKPVLSASNHLDLLRAARGLSMRQARELVAARFPSPDVPSSIRKLPEQRIRSAGAATSAASVCRAVARGNELRTPVHSAAAPEYQLVNPQPALASLVAPVSPPRVVEQPTMASVPPPFGPAPTASRSPRDRIEPLSERRYRVQFTADDQLKAKLELAADLLRHAHPGGEFAPVLSRALDLLLEQLSQRRFGATKRRRAARAPAAISVPSSPPRLETTPVATGLPLQSMPCVVPSAAFDGARSATFENGTHTPPPGASFT